MGDENRRLLEEEIEAEHIHLASLTPGTEEHSAAVESLCKLHKAKLEMDKQEIELGEAKMRRESDDEYKRAQMREAAKERWLKYGFAGIELTAYLAFSACWMGRGYEFEKLGEYATSQTFQTFRNLVSRFKPTKR